MRSVEIFQGEDFAVEMACSALGNLDYTPKNPIISREFNKNLMKI